MKIGLLIDCLGGPGEATWAQRLARDLLAACEASIARGQDAGMSPLDVEIDVALRLGLDLALAAHKVAR